MLGSRAPWGAPTGKDKFPGWMPKARVTLTCHHDLAQEPDSLVLSCVGHPQGSHKPRVSGVFLPLPIPGMGVLPGQIQGCSSILWPGLLVMDTP
jgi:hypothetical protein